MSSGAKMADHTAQRPATDEVGKALRDLLAAIEAEPVPPRISDLAKAVQDALAKRKADVPS
jgi:hypothetical protein